MSINKENLHKTICLIKEIIEIIQLPNTNTKFSEWDNPTQAINHFNQILENNDKKAIAELKIIFAPTGSLQDLAISSGWADKYNRLIEKI